jgi:calmodulin
MSSGNLDQVKEAELKEAFAMFDKDADGNITLRELATTLSLLGINPSEEELMVMFNSVDVDKNGMIDYEEFKVLMKNHLRDEPMAEEQELQETFKAFDRDGNGKIDAEELKQAMTVLGESITDGQVMEMIRAADKDGDGQINYEEFLDMLKNRSN